MCPTIREHRLGDRVVILNYEVDKDSVRVLPKGPEISCVTVRWKIIPWFGEENLQPISSLYEVLSRCAHAKSIRARSEGLCYEPLMYSLTTHIRSVTTLTDVEVDLAVCIANLRELDCRHFGPIWWWL
ncbi:hypothetical protein MRX96_022607 [Rhipicephalus microplus]